MHGLGGHGRGAGLAAHFTDQRVLFFLLGLEQRGGGHQFGKNRFQVARMVLLFFEVVAPHDGAQQMDVGRHPGNPKFGQAAAQASDRAREVGAGAGDNQFGQQGVEGRRRRISAVGVRIDAYVRARRRIEALQAPMRGARHAGRVGGLCRDAHLDGVALELGRIRRVQPQAFETASLRKSNLQRHQIDAGDLLGDRVFDLQARIGLDEDEIGLQAVLVFLDQELEGPQALVLHPGSQLLGRRENARAQLRREHRAGRNLDHFLKAAL